MILHVMILEKFMPPFIDFVDKHFGRGEHKYVFITSEKYQFGLTPEHQAEFLHTDDDIFITLLAYMKEARKIILHGLWRDKIDLLLIQNPKLFEKCYWTMWGGDFYFPEKKSKNRHEVIKNIGHLVTSTSGDVELARKWYTAKGKHIHCFNYPSNIYKKSTAIKNGGDSKIRIMTGNSADQSNNHFYLFDKLKNYKDHNILIYSPLSYGDKNYSREVIAAGKNIFEEKFIPLENFMPTNNYIDFLETIDIAAFAHKRQQAFGNTITLLGLGKKVYVEKSSTLNGVFSSLGITVHDLDNLNIDKIDNKEKKQNIAQVEKFFSKESLASSLSKWIE